MSNNPTYKAQFVCTSCGHHNVLFVNEDRVLACIKCGSPMPEYIELVDTRSGEIRRASIPVAGDMGPLTFAGFEPVVFSHMIAQTFTDPCTWYMPPTNVSRWDK